MKINARTQQKIYYNDKKSDYNSPGFTGRCVNAAKLRQLASASIYTSAGIQTANIASGGNEMLSFSGSVLLAAGCLLDAVGLFLKNSERLKLQKHIDFFKAQNVEQAANFAEQNFKIKFFDVKDLDTANWINNGLTELSNKFQGETYMPSNISFNKFKKKRLNITDALYHPRKDMICFNQNSYADIDNRLKFLMNGLDSKFKELFQALPGREDNFSDIIQRYIEKPDTFTNPQKLAMYYAIGNKTEVGLQILEKQESMVKYACQNPSAKDLYVNVRYNEFGLLYHEMGHMMRFKEQSTFAIKCKRLANISHFKKEVNQMPIPSYAKTNQDEFIAETIAGMLNGDVYSNQIMDLFNKLTSVRIPQK